MKTGIKWKQVGHFSLFQVQVGTDYQATLAHAWAILRRNDWTHEYFAKQEESEVGTGNYNVALVVLGLHNLGLCSRVTNTMQARPIFVERIKEVASELGLRPPTQAEFLSLIAQHLPDLFNLGSIYSMLQPRAGSKNTSNNFMPTLLASQELDGQLVGPVGEYPVIYSNEKIVLAHPKRLLYRFK